jgi:hypothetical protein
MNKSMVVGANVRRYRSMAFGLKLEKDIIEELRKTKDRPLSTSDLSFSLKKAWHTIDRACLMLQVAGKIDGLKIGKMNLWRKK